jgi:exosortase
MQQPKTSPSLFALNNHRLTLALKFSVITFTVVALYFQDLTLVFQGALTDESTYHILAIPFIFAYLLFRKRKMILASIQPDDSSKRGFQKYFNTIAGTLLFLVVILVYWYGSYSFTPLEFHMVTLPFMAAGLVLMFFGVQTLRQMIFPVAFLAFLTPPPSEILYSVGSALANFSAVVSNGLANVFGLHATLTSSNLGPMITILRPDGASLPFNVSVACSGIYSIVGFLIFAVFIAYITPGKLLNKLIVLLLGVPLMIMLNIVRITAILGIGFNWGEDLALEVFHNFGATALMFIGTLILLVVTEKFFKKPAAPTPCPACTPAAKNPVVPFCAKCGKLFKYSQVKLAKSDVVKVVGVLLVTVVLLSVQAPVFALTQGPAQVIAQTTSGLHVNQSNSTLPAIDGYTLQYSYRDTSYEQTSGNDAAVVYCYNPVDESQLPVWVAIQIGDSSTAQHRWETCLINYPLDIGAEVNVKQFDLRDVQLQENPPITGRYFAFEYTSTQKVEVVLYWYETATFDINGTAQTKSVMMSLIMYPQSKDEIEACEAAELPVAQAITSHWEPIKTWTNVTLALSQNGLALSSVAAVVLVLLVFYYLYLSRREKQSLLTLYRKLPAQDQLLIRAVSNLGEANSVGDVTVEYQKLSLLTVPESVVLEKLGEAARAGLIKKRLLSDRDCPVLVWRVMLPKGFSAF